MGPSRGTTDAFGRPTDVAAGEAADPRDDKPAGSAVDDVVLRVVPVVIRGFFIAAFLSLAVVGVLGGIGVLGRGGLDGFGAAAVALMFAFIIWKRMWSSIGDVFVDWWW